MRTRGSGARWSGVIPVYFTLYFSVLPSPPSPSLTFSTTYAAINYSVHYNYTFGTGSRDPIASRIYGKLGTYLRHGKAEEVTIVDSGLLESPDQR